MSEQGPFSRGSQFRADEHYRQQYESKQREALLLAGLLVGFAAGLLWEAIRR